MQATRHLTRRHLTPRLFRQSGTTTAACLRNPIQAPAYSTSSGQSSLSSPPVNDGAAAAALVAGYGASTILRRDSTRNNPERVLDEDRLPDVQYASLDDMHKAIAEIERELSDTEDIISTDPEDLHAHGYSEWSSTNLDVLPIAVAYPRNTDHVSRIVRICNKWRVPVIAFSGGSSVEGHISAPFGGVSLDLVHFDRIVQVNADDMDVVVQPGVLWTDLNQHLAKLDTGLFFPIDPSPSAKIGGMIGTNCSGTNAVRYGTMRDWVVNLTVVLADGSVVKTRRRPRKCSAGYHLSGLLVGSEGTLGIVTEATLKLAPVPARYTVAVAPFRDLRQAVSAAVAIVRRGIPVAAVELMDEEQMRVVNDGGATRPRVWREQPTLFLKFAGSEMALQEQIRSVRDIVESYGSLRHEFEFAKNEQEQQSLWSARKESLYSLLALRKDGEEMWNTDVAVPLSRLADIVEASKAEAAALGLKACVKGHVGDGNFHENITYNKADPEEAARTKQAVKNMVRRALEMDGTCTGEHGIGFGKKEALAQEVGDDALLMMKLLKAQLDPHWILNPGKIFDRTK
ncbi:hypothetical protein F4778DRAFT_795355 [Xylariomycetidae sp. FL2044]|nr:hypothetical protein F4778DRAFT_795355 [Xylariomycetidae sp. FL2044]